MTPNPGKVRIAHSKGSGRFLLAQGGRTVSISVEHVREMLGLPQALGIAMGQVREIADVILGDPVGVGGRIEHCSEQDDPDRKPGAAVHPEPATCICDSATVAGSDPYCPLHGFRAASNDDYQGEVGG